MQGTQLQSPLVWENPACHGATKPVKLKGPGACALQQEKPLPREARTHHTRAWPPLTASAEGPGRATKTQHNREVNERISKLKT